LISSFWCKFAQKMVYPLNRFLQNLASARVSQVRTLTANFTVLAYGPKKLPKIVIFGINFPQRGIST